MIAAERYTYDRMLSRPVRLAVCDWLRAHGINPTEVVVPGWIERRPVQRQVAFEACVLDDNGRPLFSKAEQDFVREVNVLQLEAPPLPFPDVVELDEATS